MRIVFKTADRMSWFRIISSYRKKLDLSEEIIIDLGNIKKKDIEPIHIVCLACMLEDLFKRGMKSCRIKTANKSLEDYIFKEMSMWKYWNKDQSVNYTKAQNDNILNLWRVKENEIFIYGEEVQDYLKRNYFKEKDFASVKNSLLEAYFNIFDHSVANGNAFSFMTYDDSKSVLAVAICDYGVGIASNIRKYYPEIVNDGEAIQKATEELITTQSKKHNRGLGLSNIVSHLHDGNTLRIVSNNGLYIVKGKNRKTFETNLNFDGTLIYYDVTLSSFDDVEFMDSYGLDF